MPYQEVLGEAVEEEERGAVAVVEAVDGYCGGEGDVEEGEVGEHLVVVVRQFYTLVLSCVGTAWTS